MQSQLGYYSVKVTIENRTFIHTIVAKSDYDAALQIRQLTGYMPPTDDDVSFLYAEDMQSDTHLPWLYKNNLFHADSVKKYI